MIVMSTTEMPNFFILGAPKCGTTSIASWLSQNEEVFITVPKEPHFFNTDMRFRRYKSESSYFGLYKNVPKFVSAIGEASTWYLYSEDAVKNILQVNSDAKFIVAVREPLDMAVSLYLHNKRHGHESAESFEEAWALQEKREQGYCIPAMCADQGFLQYKKACSLGSHIDRLLAHVPNDHVCIVWLKDLKHSPRKELRRLEDFLGVKPHEYQDLPVENTAAEVRSKSILIIFRLVQALKHRLGIRKGFGLARLNERNVKRPTISGRFKEELDLAFEHERKKLDALAERFG